MQASSTGNGINHVVLPVCPQGNVKYHIRRVHVRPNSILIKTSIRLRMTMRHVAYSRKLHLATGLCHAFLRWKKSDFEIEPATHICWNGTIGTRAKAFGLAQTLLTRHLRMMKCRFVRALSELPLSRPVHIRDAKCSAASMLTLPAPVP